MMDMNIVVFYFLVCRNNHAFIFWCILYSYVFCICTHFFTEFQAKETSIDIQTKILPVDTYFCNHLKMSMVQQLVCGVYFLPQKILDSATKIFPCVTAPQKTLKPTITCRCFIQQSTTKNWLEKCKKMKFHSFENKHTI